MSLTGRMHVTWEVFMPVPSPGPRAAIRIHAYFAGADQQGLPQRMAAALRHGRCGLGRRVVRLARHRKAIALAGRLRDHHAFRLRSQAQHPPRRQHAGAGAISASDRGASTGTSPATRWSSSTFDASGRRRAPHHRFAVDRAVPESALYNEYYRRIGIDHVVAVPLFVDDGPAGELRAESQRRDFSDRERALLDLVRGRSPRSTANALVGGARISGGCR